MMHAYIKWLEGPDRSKKAYTTTDKILYKFSSIDFDNKKKYKVQHLNGETYKAQIYSLAESKQKLEETIESGRFKNARPESLLQTASENDSLPKNKPKLQQTKKERNVNEFCQLLNIKKEQLASLISPPVKEQGVQESCESNTDQARSNNRNDKKDDNCTDINLSGKSSKVSRDSQRITASLNKTNAVDNEKTKPNAKLAEVKSNSTTKDRIIENSSILSKRKREPPLKEVITSPKKSKTNAKENVESNIGSNSNIKNMPLAGLETSDNEENNSSAANFTVRAANIKTPLAVPGVKSVKIISSVSVHDEKICIEKTNKLSQEIRKLKEDNKNLKSDYEKLEKKYSSSKEEIKTLKKENESYKKINLSLQTDVIEFFKEQKPVNEMAIPRINIQMELNLRQLHKWTISNLRPNMHISFQSMMFFRVPVICLKNIKFIENQREGASTSDIRTTDNFLPVGYYKKSEDKYHIGHNIWLDAVQFNNVMLNSNTPKKCVGNILIALFDLRILLSSTVSGNVSNRTIGKLKKQQKPKTESKTYKKLDPSKLTATKEFYNYWLNEVYLNTPNVTQSMYFEELTSFTDYVSSEIAYLKRRSQKKVGEKDSQVAKKKNEEESGEEKEYLDSDNEIEKQIYEEPIKAVENIKNNDEEEERAIASDNEEEKEEKLQEAKHIGSDNEKEKESEEKIKEKIFGSDDETLFEPSDLESLKSEELFSSD